MSNPTLAVVIVIVAAVVPVALLGWLWFVKPASDEAHVIVSAAVIISVFAICWAVDATFATAIGVIAAMGLGYVYARLREAGIDAGYRWRRKREESRPRTPE